MAGASLLSAAALVDADNLADVLVLVLRRVHGLGDVIRDLHRDVQT